MSKIIHLINKKVISAEPSKVFDTLKEHKLFREWWPEKFNVNTSELGENGEFDIMFNPAPTVQIAWKLSKTESNRMLTYSYVKGPFRGDGIWKINASESEGMTDLSYSIYLEAKSFLFNLAASTPMFRNRHLADVDSLMNSLDLYLSES